MTPNAYYQELDRRLAKYVPDAKTRMDLIVELSNLERDYAKREPGSSVGGVEGPGVSNAVDVRRAGREARDAACGGRGDRRKHGSLLPNDEPASEGQFGIAGGDVRGSVGRPCEALCLRELAEGEGK